MRVPSASVQVIPTLSQARILTVTRGRILRPWDVMSPLHLISGTLNVGIMTDFTNTVIGYPLTFFGNIEGTPSSNLWAFGDGVSISNRTSVEHGWSSAGDKAVVLTAYNTDNLGGVSATIVVHVVATPIYYVNISNATAIAPYTNWSTAATTIQDAVDEAMITGSRVIVADGVYTVGSRRTPGYDLMNRLVVTNDVTIESVNGPSTTFIVGAEDPVATNGPAAVRCVYMASGMLSGFTLTNGHTLTAGDVLRDQSGGGVYDGRLTNCIISGNTAGEYGGGAYAGMINNCMINW